jgi:hypothetical protein
MLGYTRWQLFKGLVAAIGVLSKARYFDSLRLLRRTRVA